MKKLFVPAIILFGSILPALLLSSCTCKGESQIPVCPAAVGRFAEEWFPDAQIVELRTDTEGIFVLLSDETSLTFDAAGAWLSAENRSRALPAGLVAEPVGRYLAEHYPDASVLRLDYSDGCKAGLDNGLLLVFGADMTFVEVLDWKVLIQNPEL